MESAPTVNNVIFANHMGYDILKQTRKGTAGHPQCDFTLQININNIININVLLIFMQFYSIL